MTPMLYFRDTEKRYSTFLYSINRNLLICVHSQFGIKCDITWLSQSHFLPRKLQKRPPDENCRLLPYFSSVDTIFSWKWIASSFNKTSFIKFESYSSGAFSLDSDFIQCRNGRKRTRPSEKQYRFLSLKMFFSSISNWHQTYDIKRVNIKISSIWVLSMLRRF